MTRQMSQDTDATYTKISLKYSQQRFDTCGMLDNAATFPAEAVTHCQLLHMALVAVYLQVAYAYDTQADA